MAANKAKRLEEIDIVKSISIILVVIGHTYPKCREFIYLFHVAVFFIASGFCWNEKKIIDASSWRKYISGKFQALYLPYVICNLVFLLFRNFFIKINVYTNDPLFISATQAYPIAQKLTQPYSMVTTCKEAILIVCGLVIPQVSNPTWFLLSLFIVLVVHSTVVTLCRYTKINVYRMYIPLIIVIAFFSQWASSYQIAGIIKRIPATYLAFLLGILLKKVAHRYSTCNKSTILKSFVTGSICFIVLYVLSHYGKIELSSAEINNPLFFIICSVCGWVMLYSIAEVIVCSNAEVKRMLCYIGRYSLWILILHVLSFKAVSALYVFIYNKPLYFLASNHMIFDVPLLWKVVYCVVGVSLPLLVAYMARVFRKRIVS